MFKEILKDIVNEDYVSAKASIHEALYTLISLRLDEMYEDLSVEVIEGKSKDYNKDGKINDEDDYLENKHQEIGAAIARRNRRKSQNEEADTETEETKDNDTVQVVANTLSKHMIGSNNKPRGFPPSEDITNNIRNALSGNIKYQNPQAQVPYGRED